MKRYFIMLLIVVAVELGLLFGISFFFDFNLLSTMFFGSLTFVIVAFLLGSTGDAFSKNAELSIFEALAGRYQPKHEKATLRVGPFLVGSIICFILYFVMSFLIG